MFAVVLSSRLDQITFDFHTPVSGTSEGHEIFDHSYHVGISKDCLCIPRLLTKYSVGH